MHTRGINMRYLGKLARLCEDSQKTTQSLVYVGDLCVREMVVRAAKHMLVWWCCCCLSSLVSHHCGVSQFDEMRNVAPDKSRRQEHWFLAPVVAAFLNSFLGPHCGGEGLTQDQVSGSRVLCVAYRRELAS